jgi:hypothetical protein
MEQSVDDGARTNRPDSMDDGRTVYWRTLFGIQQVDPRFELRGAESPVDQEIIRNPDRNNGGAAYLNWLRAKEKQSSRNTDVVRETLKTVPAYEGGRSWM